MKPTVYKPVEQNPEYQQLVQAMLYTLCKACVDRSQDPQSEPLQEFFITFNRSIDAVNGILDLDQTSFTAFSDGPILWVIGWIRGQIHRMRRAIARRRVQPLVSLSLYETFVKANRLSVNQIKLIAGYPPEKNLETALIDLFYSQVGGR